MAFFFSGWKNHIVDRTPLPQRKGFTLIELLIIIGILAILAALLAPVMAKAREKVRSFTCLSNLRQIGTATTLYAQDFDEHFAGPNPDPYSWMPDLHQPYLKTWRVWICPADTEAKLWDGQWDSPSFVVRISYIWNAYIFQGDPADWRRSLAFAQVPVTSSTILWMDGYANRGWVNEAAPLSTPNPKNAYIHNAYGDNLNTSPKDPSAGECALHHDRRLDTVHLGGGNYTFVDGHSKWLLPSAFTTDALISNNGRILDDRTDPLVTNGARYYARAYPASCPVLCCPKDVGTPPGDGDHPWFRP